MIVNQFLEFICNEVCRYCQPATMRRLAQKPLDESQHYPICLSRTAATIEVPHRGHPHGRPGMEKQSLTLLVAKRYCLLCKLHLPSNILYLLLILHAPCLSCNLERGKLRTINHQSKDWVNSQPLKLIYSEESCLITVIRHKTICQHFREIMKQIIFFALLTLLSSTQSKAAEIISSEIKSETLDQTRRIQVYLPATYGKTKQVYPVLYVIDGQRYFLHGVAFQKTLKFVDKSPEFIVVGIDTDNRKRRDLLGYQSSKFLDFMKSELIPHVEEKYRTSKERILFGWEMAGGFATQVMAETNLYSAYLIASPTHITKQRLDAITPKVRESKKNTPYLYFTQAEHETFADSLNELLIDIAPAELKWKYTRLVNDDHHTTPYQTIYQGLREIFNDYSPIKFHSLKDFNDFGGMEKLTEYYQQRGQRYGISTEVDDRSQYSLLITAIREDNIKSFDDFLTEFTFFTDEMIFPVWGSDWAQFYMKHNAFDKARATLVKALKQFPESAILHADMGDALVGLNKKEDARIHMVKAIELADLNNDPRVDSYKQKLAKL